MAVKIQESYRNNEKNAHSGTIGAYAGSDRLLIDMIYESIRNRSDSGNIAGPVRRL